MVLLAMIPVCSCSEAVGASGIPNQPGLRFESLGCAFMLSVYSALVLE